MSVLSPQEKFVANRLFQIRTYESNGSAYEEMFTKIMTYAYPDDFQKIKPWGNIGDRSCDGRIASSKEYYQVYAPNDLSKSYPDALKKAIHDFANLHSHWTDIRSYYFVVNDKFQGAHADLTIKLDEIKDDYALNAAKIFTASDLQNIFFRLDKDKMMEIAGGSFVVETDLLNLDAVAHVFDHLLTAPSKSYSGSIQEFPRWDDKVLHNKFSSDVCNILDYCYSDIDDLKQFLDSRGIGIADSLKDKLKEIYYRLYSSGLSGDELFFGIANEILPKRTRPYETAAFTIITLFFEVCDLFERPPRV